MTVRGTTARARAATRRPSEWSFFVSIALATQATPLFAQPPPEAPPTEGASTATESSSSPARAGASTTTELSSGSESNERGTDWQLVGGLGAWAVGMGLVVTFNYAFFRLNDVVQEDALKSYRLGVPAGESSCDRARAGVASTAAGAASAEEVASLCDEADTMESLRNIPLPVGLGAALLGLVLLGTSDSVSGGDAADERAGHWRFRVGGGPDGAGAIAAVSF
jgi:hypothetical protein